jgi:protein phosphatase PTC7
VQTPAAAAAPAVTQQQQHVVYKTVQQLRMRSAAAYLPHPDKESYGGEDAHFVSNISGGAIGVADGECFCTQVNSAACCERQQQQ